MFGSVKDPRFAQHAVVGTCRNQPSLRLPEGLPDSLLSLVQLLQVWLPERLVDEGAANSWRGTSISPSYYYCNSSKLIQAEKLTSGAC